MCRQLLIVLCIVVLIHSSSIISHNLQYNHELDLGFQVKPSCISEGLSQKLNDQQQLNKKLVEIYSLGKIPGNCSLIGLTIQQKQRFIKNAQEIKHKILSTKAALLSDRNAKLKDAATDLGIFQTKFLNCLKIIDPNSTKIMNNSKSSNKSQTQQVTKYYFTNPTSQNIIVDDHYQISKQQLQRLRQQNKTFVSCPINRPYFNGYSCISCQHYFNMNTKQCTSCQKNTKYDKTRQKCIKVIYLTNLYAKNILFRTKSIHQQRMFQKVIRRVNSKFVLKCPPDLPFARYSQCISCGDNFPLFDLQNNVCSKCQYNEVYNPNQRKCVLKQQKKVNMKKIIQSTISKISVSPIQSPNKVLFQTNPSTYGLILDNISVESYTQKYNSLKNQKNIQDCPPAQPFFNGKQCIACPGQNSKFLLSQQRCVKCPQGTVYLYNLKKCK